MSRIAQFLGRRLSAQQTADVVRRSCFHAMKQDRSVNYSWWDELGLRLPSESQFMRKGAASAELMSTSLCQDFVNLSEICTILKMIIVIVISRYLPFLRSSKRPYSMYLGCCYQCSRIRILRFFRFQKNVTFYVFLK